MTQQYGLQGHSVSDIYPLAWVGVGDFWYIQNLVTGKFMAVPTITGVKVPNKYKDARGDIITVVKSHPNAFLWVSEEQAFPGRFRRVTFQGRPKPPTNFGGWHAEVAALTLLAELEEEGESVALPKSPGGVRCYCRRCS